MTLPGLGSTRVNHNAEFCIFKLNQNPTSHPHPRVNLQNIYYFPEYIDLPSHHRQCSTNCVQLIKMTITKVLSVLNFIFIFNASDHPRTHTSYDHVFLGPSVNRGHFILYSVKMTTSLSYPADVTHASHPLVFIVRQVDTAEVTVRIVVTGVEKI